MSQWSDRITNHTVHASIQTFQQQLDQADIAAEGDGGAIEAVHRLRSVAALMVARLQSLDPDLVHPEILNNLQAAASNAAAQLNSYVGNKNAAHLNSANNHADAALLEIAKLGALLSDVDVDSIRDSVTNFRRSVGQHFRHVEEDIRPLDAEVAKLRKELEQLRGEIANERTQGTTIASNFQSQFSAAQEKRLNEFNETLHAHKQQLEDHETAWDEALDKTIATFTEKSDGLVKEIETKTEGLVKSTEAEFRLLLTNQEREAAGFLEKLKSHQEEAEKLVGIIGTAGVTSGYQKAANAARYATWFWQVIALGAMGWLVWIAVEMFLPIMTGNFSWPSLAGRVFVSLTIGVLAGYAAHQGTRYHDIERRNRRIELELASLGPYLASLPIEKQQEFRLQMADRTFGREEPSRNGEPAPPTSVTDLLKNEAVTEKIRELAISAVKELK